MTEVSLAVIYVATLAFVAVMVLLSGNNWWALALLLLTMVELRSSTRK